MIIIVKGSLIKKALLYKTNFTNQTFVVLGFVQCSLPFQHAPTEL